jgi:hypothetical protein
MFHLLIGLALFRSDWSLLIFGLVPFAGEERLIEVFNFIEDSTDFPERP